MALETAAPNLIPSQERRRPPAVALALGLAGLLPQLWALTVLHFGNPADKFSALALAYAYVALILSFLGGMWWGLAAQARAAVPGWVWFVAVAPTLIAVGSAIPWAIGAVWPGPSLTGLGVALLAGLIVDVRLSALGLCPAWWLGLRIPLSVGLALLTIAIGYSA